MENEDTTIFEPVIAPTQHQFKVEIRDINTFFKIVEGKNKTEP